MLSALVLVGLLALGGDESLTVREQNRTGVWVAPQARFNALQVILLKPPGSGGYYIAGSDTFPLGLDLGYQPWRRVMLSAGVAYDNSPIYRTVELTAGARRYLSDGVLAPYLAAEVGVLDAASHTDVFAVAGAGLELAFGSGISLMTDVQVGPENSGEAAPNVGRTWHLSAWCRLGAGYRF